MNELIVDAKLTGTDLQLTDAGGTQIVDLSSLSGIGPDDQTLSFDTGTGQLSIESGNNVTIPDVDAANELIIGAQLNTTDLEITDAGGTNIVDLSFFDNSGTDDQTLAEVLTEGSAAGSSQITDLADPVDPQDAATKAYVDAADALNSLDYAFKVKFSYTNSSGAPENDVLIDLSSPDFDDQMALSGNDYVVPVDGVFMFFVQGINGDYTPLEIVISGVPKGVPASPASFPPGDINFQGAFMYKLNASDIIQLNINNIPNSQTVSGEFFGHKL